MAEFEWDPTKDAENRVKHGVSFVDAQLAFLDPHRVIAEDLGHARRRRGTTASAASTAESWRSASTEKVTIVLSKRSIEFFRREARRNGVQYQRMIRALLDRYVTAHDADRKS